MNVGIKSGFVMAVGIKSELGMTVVIKSGFVMTVVIKSGLVMTVVIKSGLVMTCNKVRVCNDCWNKVRVCNGWGNIFQTNLGKILVRRCCMVHSVQTSSVLFPCCQVTTTVRWTTEDAGSYAWQPLMDESVCASKVTCSLTMEHRVKVNCKVQWWSPSLSH